MILLDDLIISVQIELSIASFYSINEGDCNKSQSILFVLKEGYIILQVEEGFTIVRLI